MTTRPNILLIVADHHRWDWTGYHGSVPVRTPNIDRLATGGTVFTRTICSSPLCAPSRASLATGKRPHRVGVLDNGADLDPAHTNFMQLLRNSGYRVGGTGKTDLHKATRWYGLEGWTELNGRLGFTETIDQAGKLDAWLSGSESPQDPYMAFLHREGVVADHAADYTRRMRHNKGKGKGNVPAWPTPLARRHYTDDFCGESTLHILKGFPRNEPWFLQVNFPGPHNPYDAPKELLDRYDGVAFPAPVDAEASPMTPEEHQAVRRNFAAMIDGIDEWVGRFVDAVRDRGEYDRTVVIFTSDHGEMLGDHARWGKSEPDEGSIRVPLVMAGPRIPVGWESDAGVELMDLAPTMLEWAGIDAPDDWDARSLNPVLNGEEDAGRQIAISAMRHFKTAMDRRWKLVVRGDGSKTLYDLEADPTECRPIAPGDEHAEIVERLEAALARGLPS